MKRFNYASLTLIGLIVLVATIRIGHLLPNNFAPVTALCLLGSAYFTRKWMAFVFPAAILILSDASLGMGRPVETFGVYFSYLLIVILGFGLGNNARPVKVLGFALSSSILFFLITNFTCWIGNSAAYTQDLSGLVFNYTGALPYYRASFISDIFFSVVFFTAFELLKVRFPKFATVR